MNSRQLICAACHGTIERQRGFMAAARDGGFAPVCAACINKLPVRTHDAYQGKDLIPVIFHTAFPDSGDDRGFRVAELQFHLPFGLVKTNLPELTSAFVGPDETTTEVT